MKKYYVLFLMLAAMVMPSAVCGQRALRLAPGQVKAAHEARRAEREEAMRVPREGNYTVEVTEFPFTYECEGNSYYTFTFTLEKESMVKVNVAEGWKDGDNLYVLVDGMSAGDYPEMEIRMDAGEHSVTCQMYSLSAPRTVVISLGEKVYREVGEPETTDITLPFKSGKVDFEANADTVMSTVVNGMEVFTRAILYRIETGGKWFFGNVKLGEETWFGYSNSVVWAASSYFKSDVMGWEGGNEVMYVAVVTTGESAEIEIAEMDMPMADDMYKDAEEVKLPYSGEVVIGEDVLYSPEDSQKEWPLYFTALRFTLEKETEVFVSDTAGYCMIVKSGEIYYAPESTNGNSGSRLDRYSLSAGTYYYVCVSEEKERKEYGHVNIMTERPEWLLDDYTEADYAERLPAGKKVYGTFTEGSPVIDGYDSDCGYVRGFSIEAEAGKVYTIELNMSAAGGYNSFSLYVLGGGQLTGETESDAIEGINGGMGSGDEIKTVFSPEVSGTYRVLLIAGHTNGDVMYSLMLKEEAKPEHYRELTLPCTIDTVIERYKAMEQDGRYFYGWKVTADEPYVLTMDIKNTFDPYRLRVYFGSPDGNEVYGYTGGAGYTYYAELLEAGEYYITADGYEYVPEEENHLRMEVDGLPINRYVEIESLPYELSVPPSMDDAMMNLNTESLFFGWSFYCDKDTAIVMECIADGDTLLTSNGFPTWHYAGKQDITIPAGEYEEFSLTVRYATGEEIDTVTVDELFGGVTESGTLPMHIKGELDVNSKYITTDEYYVGGYMAEAYGFTVPEAEGTLFLELSNADAGSECYFALYRKTDEGYMFVTSNNLYSEYKERVTLEEPGDYYMLMCMSPNDLCYMGVRGWYSLDVSLVSVKTIITVEELLNGVTEYTQLPTTLKGVIDGETPVLNDYWAYDLDKHAAVAWKIDLNDLKGRAELHVMSEEEMAGATIIYRKTADGGYERSENVTEVPGDYYIVYGVLPEEGIEVKYTLALEADIAEYVTVEELLSEVTESTPLPSEIKAELTAGMPIVNDGTLSGYYRGAAFRLDITEEMAGTSGGALKFVDRQTTDGDYYTWYYALYQKTAEGYTMEAYGDLSTTWAVTVGEAGEWYLLILYNADNVPVSTSMRLEWQQISRPDEDNALTIEELLAQTTEESPLPLSVKDKAMNGTTVLTEGIVNGGTAYMFADAYRVTLTEPMNAFVGISYVYGGVYLAVYRQTTDGYEQVMAGQLNTDIPSAFAIGAMYGLTAGEYYFVLMDANYGLNSYSMTIVGGAETIEEKMRRCEEAVEMPTEESGSLDVMDAEAFAMVDGELALADVYRFELTEGMNVRFEAISETMGYMSGQLYYHDPESDTFESYGGVSDMEIYRSGTYYYAVYMPCTQVQYYSIPYKLTAGWATMSQRVVKLEATPESITVDEPDNEAAIRLELAAEVTLTAMTDHGERFEIEHSAFDWVLDENMTTATYTYTKDGASVSVTVYVNPEMVTVTVTAGEHGTIDPAGAVETAKGLDKEFTVRADAGYVVDEVYVNGVAVKSGLEGRESGTYVLKDAAEGMTLNVTFAPQEEKPIEVFTVTVDVNDETMGKVAVSGGETDWEGKYYNGSVIMVLAEAYTGYEFVRWSDGVTEPVREITVTGDVSFTAIFGEKVETFTVNVKSDDEAMGRVEISGDEPVEGNDVYAAGAVLNIKAVAAGGYEFMRWSDGETEAERTVVVESDVTLVAYFAKTTQTDDVRHEREGFTLYSQEGILYIDTEKADAEVTVYDLAGRTVYRGMERTVYVGVPGVYVVVLDGESQKVAVR